MVLLFLNYFEPGFNFKKECLGAESKNTGFWPGVGGWGESTHGHLGQGKPRKRTGLGERWPVSFECGDFEIPWPSSWRCSLDNLGGAKMKA